MKKCFELTPCLLAFLCITSCVEDVDNERSKGNVLSITKWILHH